jgi:hypothetical protein
MSKAKSTAKKAAKAKRSINPKYAALLDKVNADPRLREFYENCCKLSDKQLEYVLQQMREYESASKRLRGLPGPTQYAGPAYSVLENEMFDWVNALDCAWHALESSHAVDADETASRARNVIHLCEKNLTRLLNDLQVWEMRTRSVSRLKEAANHG